MTRRNFTNISESTDAMYKDQDVWFTSHAPRLWAGPTFPGYDGGEHKPPDERTLKLGKSKSW